MARPEKTGLDIYPCDVDYYLDDSVAAVTREFGFKAEVIFVRMMCAIYRGGGYYMHWTDQQEMALLKELPGVGRELLRSVVIRLVGYGYFDKRLFDAKRVAHLLLSRKNLSESG